MFTTTPSKDYTQGWVTGVAATGTFIKNFAATWDVIGTKGVPTGWTVKSEAVPIGRFTVSANGDQVGFAPGNLQCTVQSAFAVDSQVYIGSGWCFATNQWDYLGTTDSSNSFTVGKKMDLFGWIGESADYETYGLCKNNENVNIYYGTSASDRLKADWGDIPGVISACGDGWFTLTQEQWYYAFSTRAGGTVGNTSSARFAAATIRTDVSGVNGIILFPDGCTIAASEFTTLGKLNTDSAWLTKCTEAQWAALEAKGCVFLPAAGTRQGTSLYVVGSRGLYWASSVVDNCMARQVKFESYGVTTGQEGYRREGCSVRLAKRLK